MQIIVDFLDNQRFYADFLANRFLQQNLIDHLLTLT